MTLTFGRDVDRVKSLIARGHRTDDNGLTWHCKFCPSHVTLQGGCDGLDDHIIVCHAGGRPGPEVTLKVVANA